MVFKKMGLLLLTTLAIWAGATACSKDKTREKTIAFVDVNCMQETFIVSPNGRRVAFVVREDDHEFVVVDGKKGKKYREIMEGTLSFSPDSESVVYGARLGGELGEVTVDGKKETPVSVRKHGDVIWSPDKKRTAYQIVMGDSIFITGEKLRMVVDGEEMDQYEYDELIEGPVFSPDGKRVAYAVKAGEKCFAVVDGKGHDPYDVISSGTLGFSPDSGKVFYEAITIKGNSIYDWLHFAVVDGTDGKQYGAIGRIVCGPDGKHMAYRAILNKEEFLVIDGKEQSVAGEIQESTLVFSPDGKKTAYIIKEKSGWFSQAVIDGKAGKPYPVIKNGPCFSPDSKRVAYVVQANEKEFVVVDGKEEKGYDEIVNDSFKFSADGKRIAYAVKTAPDNFCVIVDGIEGKPYEQIANGALFFSPDGKRVVYRAVAGPKWFAVVDGEEKKAYPYMNFMVDTPIENSLEGSVFFDPSGSIFHYLVFVKNHIVLVEERLP
ncbi:MAG: hypothetical protein EHM45_04395 [Desulfobacteraceae bacterium]|nr:MAG: hypothetical protein EHM45_04395 [Desulfobacteraceae bacterium]